MSTRATITIQQGQGPEAESVHLYRHCMITFPACIVIEDPCDPRVTYYLHPFVGRYVNDRAPTYEPLTLAEAQRQVDIGEVLAPHFYRVHRPERTAQHEAGNYYYVPDGQCEHECHTEREARARLAEVIADLWGLEHDTTTPCYPSIAARLLPWAEAGWCLEEAAREACIATEVKDDTPSDLEYTTVYLLSDGSTLVRLNIGEPVWSLGGES